MSRGPQGQQHPADSVGMAVRVARTATGEDEETPTSVPTAGQILGWKDGPRSVPASSPGQRQARARQGAAGR